MQLKRWLLPGAIVLTGVLASYTFFKYLSDLPIQQILFPYDYTTQVNVAKQTNEDKKTAKKLEEKIAINQSQTVPQTLETSSGLESQSSVSDLLKDHQESLESSVTNYRAPLISTALKILERNRAEGAYALLQKESSIESPSSEEELSPDEKAIEKCNKLFDYLCREIPIVDPRFTYDQVSSIVSYIERLGEEVREILLDARLGCDEKEQRLEEILEIKRNLINGDFVHLENQRDYLVIFAEYETTAMDLQDLAWEDIRPPIEILCTDLNLEVGSIVDQSHSIPIQTVSFSVDIEFRTPDYLAKNQ